jgi:protein-S-isoprenylcysteine O-methyltransferase Ste14
MSATWFYTFDKKGVAPMGESNRKDKANVRFPPPLVFVAVVLTGYLLDRFFLVLPLIDRNEIRIAAIIVFTFTGSLLLLLSFIHFKRTGQKPEPWTSTPEIISSGIYRYSRNPMYVGMGLLQLAFAAGFNTWWIILLLPLSLYLVYLIAVRHEELYLEAKFGDTYRQYKDSVRRCL